MLSGFPANSVFIVDSEDRVRHHTVLDPRFYLYDGPGDAEHDDVVGDGGDVCEPQGRVEHGGGGEAGGCLQVSLHTPLTFIWFRQTQMDLHEALLLSLFSGVQAH